MQYYTERQFIVFVGFPDISKALDLLNYDKLWCKMLKSNIPIGVINIYNIGISTKLIL